MKKIFLQSYEDNTYLGGECNISGEKFETLCSTSSWTEAIEILRESVLGEFKFYESFENMNLLEGKVHCVIYGLGGMR